MTKKYPRKGDCYDCGTNVPGIKVTAYGAGENRDRIRNGCGECGQTWKDVPSGSQKKHTVFRSKG